MAVYTTACLPLQMSRCLLRSIYIFVLKSVFTIDNNSLMFYILSSLQKCSGQHRFLNSLYEQRKLNKHYSPSIYWYNLKRISIIIENHPRSLFFKTRRPGLFLLRKYIPKLLSIQSG